MGKRHVKYGAEDEHYTWVGNTLLKSFEHFFGDQWTPQLREQWTLAYNFMAYTMMEGAVEARKENVVHLDPGHGDSIIVEFELPESLKTAIQGSVKNAVNLAIKNEIERLLSDELNSLNADKVLKAIKLKKAS